MRARLGILFAELPVELREVELRNKPAQMLAISPKGTVPVLKNLDGSVVEESLDIVTWALEKKDPQGLLNEQFLHLAKALVEKNDKEFKYWLDRYKYADRYLEMSQAEYQRKGETFLQILEGMLGNGPFLMGSHVTIADIAIMPFVRQFAHVDRDTFYALPYPNLQLWLARWLEHPLFLQAMTKYKPWKEGDDLVVFPS